MFMYFWGFLKLIISESDEYITTDYQAKMDSEKDITTGYQSTMDSGEEDSDIISFRKPPRYTNIDYR